MATASLVGNTGATSKEQNFAAVIGEDFVLTYTITDLAAAAVDLDNFTVSWNMFLNPLSAVSATLTIVGAVAGGGANTLTVTAADTLTDSIEPRVYSHELKITSAGGTETETIVALGSADCGATQT